MVAVMVNIIIIKLSLICLIGSLKVAGQQQGVGDCTPSKTNDCVADCVWTDGTHITLDITDTVSYPYTINTPENAGNGYFKFTPCRGAKCSQSNNFNSAVCQIETNGKVYSAGRVGPDFTIWSLISISPSYNFTVLYINGDCIDIGNCKQSQFIFEEDSNSDKATIQYVDTAVSTYIFKVVGNCVGQQSCNESPNVASLQGVIGFVLIALMLLGVLLYFVVGVLVMKFWKGAQGREMIPNYNFWVGLPFLVKDGFLFVIRPIYKRGNKEYETL